MVANLAAALDGLAARRERIDYVDTEWTFRAVHRGLRLAYFAGFYLAIAPQRWRRGRLMLKGLADGLRGATGPLR